MALPEAFFSQAIPDRVRDHGGSLAAARDAFPDAPKPWIDLSTGINPHSYPLFDLPQTALTRLPEPAQIAEVAAVAARSYGAPSAENVVAAPGTQILLPLVAKLVKPGRAVVLSPTYAEHARTAALAGHRVIETDRLEALAEADLAVVVNPNNPDGRVVERQRLLDLAAALHRKGGLLLVDEAFMDVGPLGSTTLPSAAPSGLSEIDGTSRADPHPYPSPHPDDREAIAVGGGDFGGAGARDPLPLVGRGRGGGPSAAPSCGPANPTSELWESLAGDVEFGGIVVLKSFGKFFGLAGLRLGFAIGSAIAGRLEDALGPWAVSGAALEYGLKALADGQWQSAMRLQLAEEAEALDALLARHGIPVKGGTPLFRFVEHPEAAQIFNCLGRHGILVRRFDRLPNCLRFGLPAGEAEMSRLDQALTAWAESKDERA